MVSLEGQSEQSKQSLVAPSVRGELFEGGQCILREGWTDVNGALSLYRYPDQEANPGPQRPRLPGNSPTKNGKVFTVRLKNVPLHQQPKAL